MRNLFLLLTIFSFSCVNDIDDSLEESKNKDIQEKKGCFNNCFSSNDIGFNAYAEIINYTYGDIIVNWDYSNNYTIINNPNNNCNTTILLEFKAEAGVTLWETNMYALIDDNFTVDITSEFLANPQGSSNIYIPDFTNSYNTLGTSGSLYDVRISINMQCASLGCCQTTEWKTVCMCVYP